MKTKRGPRAGKAHKLWANRRLNREDMIAAKLRGRDFIIRFALRML